MEKLKQLSRAELNEKYLNEFGLPADHQPTNAILAALWYGKRIKYLTEEEINSIEED
jgi:hypothetical protein